jgi:ribosome-associated protein
MCQAPFKGEDMENPEASIRLDQFMKLVGLVRSGGEAKHLIQEGQVLLNGVVETHRSKKLHVGDRVTLGEKTEVVEDLQIG